MTKAAFEAVGLGEAEMERLASHAIALHWQEVYARLAAEVMALRALLAEHGIEAPEQSDVHGSEHALQLFRLYLSISQEAYAYGERLSELFAEVRQARGFLT